MNKNCILSVKPKFSIVRPLGCTVRSIKGLDLGLREDGSFCVLLKGVPSEVSEECLLELVLATDWHLILLSGAEWMHFKDLDQGLIWPSFAALVDRVAKREGLKKDAALDSIGQLISRSRVQTRHYCNGTFSPSFADYQAVFYRACGNLA